MVPVHASTRDPPGEGGGFPEQRAARPDAGIRGSPRVCRLDQLVVGPGVPLTDAQWARIEPLLPDRTPKRGGRRRDHREVIDAIAFKFQTGIQWLHVPDKEVWQPARCLQPAADVGRRWHLGAGVHCPGGPGRRERGPARRTTMPSAGPAAD
ncbi:transposase [Streptomyces mirabilis]|uniref:transposase n=1 Tax=Streptomyces mirabilis TaxID=68239 RepID=UPI00382E2CFD